MAPRAAVLVLMFAVLAFADGAVTEGASLLVVAVVLAVPWPTPSGRPRARRRGVTVWWSWWRSRE